MRLNPKSNLKRASTPRGATARSQDVSRNTVSAIKAESHAQSYVYVMGARTVRITKPGRESQG